MMRDEYQRKDLGQGRRGTHFKAYQASHNIVRIEPDLAKIFPNDKAVNEALAKLVQLREALIAGEQSGAAVTFDRQCM